MSVCVCVWGGGGGGVIRSTAWFTYSLYSGSVSVSDECVCVWGGGGGVIRSTAWFTYSLYSGSVSVSDECVCVCGGGGGGGGDQEHSMVYIQLVFRVRVCE